MIRNDEGWPEDSEALAERAVMAALAGSGARIVGPAEVSVVLTDDAEQAGLNHEWRGKEGSTNVLSFPQIEAFGPVRGLLGDIVLARETVEREAEVQGTSFADHLTHLCVHGFLHILGYDHLTETEALQMERLETQILGGLGIADPYAGSEPG